MWHFILLIFPLFVFGELTRKLSGRLRLWKIYSLIFGELAYLSYFISYAIRRIITDLGFSEFILTTAMIFIPSLLVLWYLKVAIACVLKIKTKSR